MAGKKTKPADPLVQLRDEWCGKLDDEDKAHRQWRDYAKRANDEYFAVACNSDNTESSSNVGYPLFWSIVNVLHGRIFAQPPTPDVRKRYIDEPSRQSLLQPGQQQLGPASNQPQQQSPGPPAGGPPGIPPPGAGMPTIPPGAGGPGGGQGQPVPGMGPGGPVPPPIPAVDDNKIAELIQRAITYTIDTTEFAKDGHAAVNDFLVTSLGQAKIEMDVETVDVPILHPDTQEPLPALDEDGNTKIDNDGNPLPATQTVIVDQTLRLRHFAWNQFRWEPQQHWSQCQWIAFEHLLTKEEIEDEWGVTLSAPSFGSTGVFKAGGGSGVDDKKPQSDKYEKLFKVYEIWDKKKRQVVYVCYQHDQALEVRDDPLKLKGFYPCPCPMMLNVRGDDLVPQPDFAKCESMFQAANVLFGRIDSLTKQVKDVGFYDGAFADLVKLTTADDGTLVPISNLLKQFNDINPGNAMAGYDAVVFKQDNKVKVETIQLLTEQLAQLEQQIWKSYGVSDIQRGATDPNETATAQSIKAQWADIRVGQRISGVAMFMRDIFRIMADVIATFPPDVLEKMTGIALNPAEMAVLQSDVGRCYAIDIESDSTASQNEMAEQGQRLQFLEVTTKYLQTIGPAMQQGQIPADLGKELLLVLVNSFKIGRQLEDTIDNLPSSIQQLGMLNQRVAQLTQQVQGLTEANKGLTKQLQGVNMGAEDRANLKASTDAQTAAADNRKTDAETMHEQVLAAKDAQEIGHMAKSPHPAVVPFRPINPTGGQNP